MSKAIKCDWCGRIIEGDYINATRRDKCSFVMGESDYCLNCWNKYHHYPDIIVAKTEADDE